MDEKTSQTSENENETNKQNPEFKPKKSKNKLKPLIVLLLFLLIGGSAYGAYLVKNKNDQLKTKNEKIALLETAPLIEEKYTDADEAGENSSKGECTGGSTYAAEVGKFKITVDSPRVIIRSIDGGYEGGPLTALEIGNCMEGESLVIDSYLVNKVTIMARPVTDANELKNSYESQAGELTEESSVPIAGTTATGYIAPGIGETKVLFFNKDGIGYQIELNENDALANATLNDIVNEWEFTP
jgi:hypothetical protein